jgi:hypothetical protein
LAIGRRLATRPTSDRRVFYKLRDFSTLRLCFWSRRRQATKNDRLPHQKPTRARSGSIQSNMRWLSRLALPLQALDWSDITKAPLVVTGQVIAIQMDPAAPTPYGGLIAATAEIEVSRVFDSTAISPKPGEHVRMSYFTIDRGWDHALRLADQPTGDRTDLSSSVFLLRDYGSEEQR